MLQLLARESIHSAPAVFQAPLSCFWAAHLIALKEGLNLSEVQRKIKYFVPQSTRQKEILYVA